MKEILRGILQEALERVSPSGRSRRDDAGGSLSPKTTSWRGDAGRRRLPQVAELFRQFQFFSLFSVFLCVLLNFLNCLVTLSS